MTMDDFMFMLRSGSAVEEEDIFDGVLPGDISSSAMDAYEESIGKEKGSLWEETVT